MLANIMKRDILSIIGIIAVLGGVGFLLFITPKATEFGYAPVDVGGGSITIEDQDQIDRIIFNAELVKPGFITVHRTMSTAPAEIIGTSSYLSDGVYDDMVIALDAEMLPGFRYVVILHVDDGDKIFVTLDDFPVMTDGKVVKQYFVAIPGAERIEFPGEETIEELIR